MRKREMVDQDRPLFDLDRSKLLAALTLAAVEKLCGETLCVDPGGKLRRWRTARILDLLLIDQPADADAPRCINVYLVEGHDIDPASGLAESGVKFRFDPERLLYAVRWLHKGDPPDLDLTLAPSFALAPDVWFPHATMLLLGSLQEVDPELRERIAGIG